MRFDLAKDLMGWRPEHGKHDKHGHPIEDRIYNLTDFDKSLVLEKRTELVTRKITEFLRATNRFDKTISNIFIPQKLLLIAILGLIYQLIENTMPG